MLDSRTQYIADLSSEQYTIYNCRVFVFLQFAKH